MSYVDLHCHLLPALDDGPGTFADSVAMIEVAWEAGTRRMVATPHMFQERLGSDDAPAVTGFFADFERRLASHRVERGGGYLDGLELTLGAENYVGEAFLSALAEGRVLSLGASRYLLMEFWPMVTATTARQAIDVVIEHNYVPVLAHVERYGFLHGEPRRLENLLAAGCVAQVNASAVLGHQGLRFAQLTDRWLSRGLIAVVASDGHGAESRRPELHEVADHLESRYGHATESACLRDNPEAILADQAPVLPVVERRSWWRRLGG